MFPRRNCSSGFQSSLYAFQSYYECPPNQQIYEVYYRNYRYDATDALNSYTNSCLLVWEESNLVGLPDWVRLEPSKTLKPWRIWMEKISLAMLFYFKFQDVLGFQSSGFFSTFLIFCIQKAHKAGTKYLKD